MPAIAKLCLLLAALLLGSTAGCSRQEPKRPLTPDEIRGQRLFHSTCAACHRADSTDPVNGPGLEGVMKKRYLPSGAPANDERVRELLKTGRRTMPPYQGILDDRQMNDIIAYLKTL